MIVSKVKTIIVLVCFKQIAFILQHQELIENGQTWQQWISELECQQLDQLNWQYNLKYNAKVKNKM